MIPAYLLQEASTMAPKIGAAASSIGPKLVALAAMLSKIPGGVKSLGTIKNLLSVGIPAMFVGSVGLTQLGAMGDRNVAREKLAQDADTSRITADVMRRMTLESRAHTKELTKEQIKLLREQAKNERVSEQMKMFSESQDRQMAMLMSAIQLQAGRPTGAPSQQPGGGMFGVMRGDY